MRKSKTQQLLEEALLHDGPMSMDLYHFELEPLVEELIASLKKDHDEYLYSVTHNRGDVAMVLIEQSGAVHVNEAAREKLQAYWPLGYDSNMKMLIPSFAKELDGGEIPVTGVKTVR